MRYLIQFRIGGVWTDAAAAIDADDAAKILRALKRSSSLDWRVLDTEST